MSEVYFMWSTVYLLYNELILNTAAADHSGKNLQVKTWKKEDFVSTYN